MDSVSHLVTGGTRIISEEFLICSSNKQKPSKGLVRWLAKIITYKVIWAKDTFLSLDEGLLADDIDDKETLN